MGGCNEVGPLQNMMMIAASHRYMIIKVEDMKVGNPIRVSLAGLRTGTSAKVQIDYGLRDAYTRTGAAHSKQPVDRCVTRSL